MLMRDWMRVGLFIAGLGFTGSAVAESVTWFEGLYQYPAQGAPVLIAEGERYQREQYPLVGGVLAISAYDGITLEFPEDGEYWIVRVVNADTGQIYTSTVFVYDEPSDCLYHDGSEFYCGLLPEQRPGVSYLYITMRYQMSCISTLNYALQINHGVGGTEAPLSESPYTFRPTRFPPEIIAAEIPFELRPNLPGDNFVVGHPSSEVDGEERDINVVVYDALGCGQPLDNVHVKLQSRIVPASGSHQHFDDTEEDEMRGTGDFIAKNGSLDTVDSEKVSITGITRNNGFYTTAYKAGDFGVSEEMTVTAWHEKTDKEPRQEDQARNMTDIRLQGLYALPLEDASYRFVYGGSCAHSPKATYVTPLTGSKIRSVADTYIQKYDSMLSLNDASLEYGGAFDNFTGKRTKNGVTTQGQGGRDWLCHQSHRRGIDVDVNEYTRKVENPVNKDHSLFGYTQIEGAPVLRQELLNGIACDFGMKPIDEPSIHYRSVSSCVVEKTGEDEE